MAEHPVVIRAVRVRVPSVTPFSQRMLHQPDWWNWQTHCVQGAARTARESSNLSSGTTLFGVKTRSGRTSPLGRDLAHPCLAGLPVDRCGQYVRHVLDVGLAVNRALLKAATTLQRADDKQRAFSAPQASAKPHDPHRAVSRPLGTGLLDRRTRPARSSAPSSSGLGPRPFTPQAPVRIRLGSRKRTHTHTRTAHAPVV